MNVSEKYEGAIAHFYDADHSWRDYRKQASALSKLFPRPDERGAVKVLELCCGSGSHSLELAKLGFDVTGMDTSKPLLKIAKQKLNCAGLRADIVEQDIFAVAKRPAFRNQFDVCALLGWTFNIYPMYRRSLRIFKSAHWLLKPAGIFIFDAVIGPESHPVPNRVLRYRTGNGWKGELRIEEMNGNPPNVRRLAYHWRIFKDPASKIPLELTAFEKLAVLRHSDILSAVRDHGKFEVLWQSGGYDPSRPFRKGNKNLVMALKKSEE